MRKLAYLVAAVALSGCSNSYRGIVYPIPDDYITDFYVGYYSALDVCREAPTAVMRAMGAYEGNYECGKNCEIMDYELELYVCDETFDG